MDSISKAQKGTAQYEEWLRKYNEKRKKSLEQKQEVSKVLTDTDKQRVQSAVQGILSGRMTKVVHNLLSIKDEDKLQRRFDAISKEIPEAKLSELKSRLGSAVPSIRAERRQKREEAAAARAQIEEAAKPAIDLAVKAAVKHFTTIKDSAKFNTRLSVLISALGDNNPIVSAVKEVAKTNGIEAGEKHYSWQKSAAKDRDRVNSIILNPLKEQLSKVEFDQATVDAANITPYEYGFTRFLVDNSAHSVEKAKKGTPEYAEWLRKYNEKRRKKQDEPEVSSSKSAKDEMKDFVRKVSKFATHVNGDDKEAWADVETTFERQTASVERKAQDAGYYTKRLERNGGGAYVRISTIPFEKQAAKSILEDKDSILASARKQVEQLDLFPQFSQDEKAIESTPIVDLAPAQDIRVAKQTQSAMAGVKVDGELLKATRQPVFANMFGHYPVEPLQFRERTITSDYEQVDVALANEPDEITEDIWEDESWIATEKVDGCRCTLICTPEATRCTARRQQGVTKAPTDYTNNLPHIRDLDLYAILGDTVIDSESVASNPIEIAPGKFGDSLASTMSILGQEKDLSICVERMNKYGPLVNFCFDIQRFEGKDLRGLPYVERMKYLDEALDRIQKAYGTTYIKKVAVQKEGESKKDFFLRVVGNSGEGCVLAKADGTYKAFDRKNRLKAKRQLELTLEIMEVLEGVGRNAGSAGSFVMGARVNGQLVPIANLNVGSDELRKEAWENKVAFIGKCVEVKSMQMTLGSGKDGMPRLRHARWKTPGLLRTDKNVPDDLSETVAIMRKRRDTGKR